MKLSDDYNAWGGFATQIYILTLIFCCGSIPLWLLGLFSLFGIWNGLSTLFFIGIIPMGIGIYIYNWGMRKQEIELAKSYGMTLDQWRKL